MKKLLAIEYLALIAWSLYTFSLLPYAWWWYPILFLVPDIGMVGYFVSPRLGAATYNLTHHLFVGFGLYVAGALCMLPAVQLAGVIIVGHSGADRAFGFGLKYPDSFKHTHLGVL